MQISDGRAAYRPLNFDKVLQTPGARLDLDSRGEIVVRMPRQTRSFGLRLLAWFSRSPQQAVEHSKQKMSERYEVAQDQGLFRMRGRGNGVVASPREQAINFLVAEAFVRRQRLEAQAAVTKQIRERLVQLPHKLFANQLAQLARELDSDRPSMPAGAGASPGVASVSRTTEARRMVQVVKLAQQLQENGLADKPRLVNSYCIWPASRAPMRGPSATHWRTRVRQSSMRHVPDPRLRSRPKPGSNARWTCCVAHAPRSGTVCPRNRLPTRTTGPCLVLNCGSRSPTTPRSRSTRATAATARSTSKPCSPC